MPMSKIRKKLQDKLRRKYSWSTNTDHNSGAMLIKSNASSHMNARKDKYVIDLSVYISDYIARKKIHDSKKSHDLREIVLYLTKCKQQSDGTFKYDRPQLEAYLSFEELELIYNIAKEYIEEIRSDISNEKGNDLT